MTNIQAAISYLNSHHDEALDELKTLVAIPSVSTLGEHGGDMHRAAEFLADKMRRMGLDHVAIMPTAGHPVIYGDWLHAPGKPTVLVYGHYDVQPVDPLNEWLSEPFVPTVRGDNLYGRGASDMKGQVMAFMTALELSLQKGGGLNCNVKVLVEGEEEIGSPHLADFLATHKDLLKSDFSLNADSGIINPTTPAIVYGLRGLAYFELWLYGAEHDLHSGVFGGAVPNPATILCEVIAGMHDADGRITLPGFYDPVRTLSEEERTVLARHPYDQATFLGEAGNPPMLTGEKGYSTLERLGARPTLEVNGLYSGFIGQGSKTVLPGKAMAKVSMRLVPNQDPNQVEEQFKAYLNTHVPPSVKWTIAKFAGAPGVITDRESDYVRAASKALTTVFGIEPVFRLEGGSVPVVSSMQDILGIDSVIMGFGLPDDNLHAPNEKYHLPNFYHGIETFIRFFDNL